MKTATRTVAFLLALFFAFSLFSCGKTAPEPAEGPSDRVSATGNNVNPSKNKGEDVVFREDAVFPGMKNTRFYIFSFENYKIIRDAVAEGGKALEDCLAFVRKDLGNDTQVKSAAQIEALVTEIGNVKILLPGSDGWTLSYFSRKQNETSAPFLYLDYKHPELGEFTTRIVYFENREKTVKEFFHTNYVGDIYNYRYIPPEPYFTANAASGETFFLFHYDYSENSVIFTESSTILFNFNYKNAKTDEEKEAVIRSFVENAEILTVNEAADKMK